jgi:hypothetical protein
MFIAPAIPPVEGSAMSSSEVYASYETARQAGDVLSLASRAHEAYLSTQSLAHEAYENAVDTYLATALGDAETEAAAAAILAAAYKAFQAATPCTSSITERTMSLQPHINDLARIDGYTLYNPTASVFTYDNHVAHWDWSNGAGAAAAFEEGWNMAHADWLVGAYPKALQKPERTAS